MGSPRWHRGARNRTRVIRRARVIGANVIRVAHVIGVDLVDLGLVRGLGAVVRGGRGGSAISSSRSFASRLPHRQVAFCQKAC